MKSWILAVGLVGACAVAAGACTVKSDDGNEGGGGTSTSSSTSSSSSSSSGGGQGGGGQGGGDEGCAAKCDTDHPLSTDAANNVLLGLIRSCGCAAGGACATACDTADQATDFCADDGTVNDTAMNEACQGCANDVLDAFTDPCVSVLTEVCGTDEVCNAWVTCINACP